MCVTYTTYTSMARRDSIVFGNGLLFSRKEKGMMMYLHGLLLGCIITVLVTGISTYKSSIDGDPSQWKRMLIVGFIMTSIWPIAVGLYLGDGLFTYIVDLYNLRYAP